MSDKVVISREFGEAIKSAKTLFDSEELNPQFKMTDFDWLQRHLSLEDYTVLNQMFADNPNTYIKAVTEGFEVEKTPLEQLQSMYDSYSIHANSNDYEMSTEYGARMETLLEVLDILNVKIDVEEDD